MSAPPIRQRRRIFAGLLTAALLSVISPINVASAAAAPQSSGILIGSTGSPAGVSPLDVDPGPTPRANPNPPMFTLNVTDPQKAAQAQLPGQPIGEGGGYYCTPYVDWDFSDIGEDGYLEETVEMDYYGQVDCNFTLASIEAASGVIDRSPTFLEESFDDDVISVGTYFYDEWVNNASSFGGLQVAASTYNGGRRVEPGIEAYLLAPEGLLWGSCEPLAGLRYIVCEGLNTPYLHVLVGPNGQQSGLTRACRDQNATGDVEQERLFEPYGSSTPASTHILRRITSVKDLVKSFKKDLCAVTSASAAASFADQRGLQLWETAVTEAKNNSAQGDDRPLYWARLSMTVALSQWRPQFAVNHTALQASLDKASRGMTSHDFGIGTGKKVFISGFDPFGLTSALYRGNPSGAAVLRLDNTTVAGARVQAVIFPVRFREFNTGLVEDIFTPHVASGSQQADLITTVSQGRTQFDLEYYNGRRRSGGADNLNVSYGSDNDPVVPLGIGSGDEFVPTTLPIDSMRVGSPYLVNINTKVREQAPPGSAWRDRTDGPTLGARAVAGGGGGYLSNEIAYRVTRLRDALGVSVPAGHVHTPTLRVPTTATDGGFDAERNSIANQYRTILEAAIGAPNVPLVRVTANSSTYSVGDTPIYTVTGPPNATIKWTTATVNDVPTSEVDASYGHQTNGSRTWQGGYHTWQATEVGQWRKYVRVDGRLARVTLTVQPAAPQGPIVSSDFDGDNHSDVAVWRPSNGTWYVMPSGGSWYGYQFGLQGDLPVDGDFDGDGRTDYAVFRPSTGIWHIQQSRDGYRTAPFGIAGDIPTAADYDGDRKTDIAVWRPSENTWYVMPSAGSGYYGVPFGATGDQPVAGDYDGDAKADLAVFRPSTGTWIVQRTSDGQTQYVGFGLNGDRSVPADYDGDGKTDPAVFRPSDGVWHLLRSSTGYTTVQWGLGSDVAAPADFDGDGKTDRAVYRPSEGGWYIHYDSGATEFHAFGLSGDIPIPGVNVTTN